MTNRDFFDACYDILIRECAAPNRDRLRFVDAVTAREHPCTEWRFMGSLGFGGKFYVDHFRERCPVRVGCYREDDTPERLAAIDRANKALAVLWDSERVSAEMGR